MSLLSKRTTLLGSTFLSLALLLPAPLLQADSDAATQDENTASDPIAQQRVIRNAGFDELQVNTATNFSRYRTVLIEDIPVSFIARWLNEHRQVVNNRDIARIRQDIAEGLRAELAENLSADGRYRIVEKAEVDTLIIKPAIIDLNVAAPGSGQHIRLVDSAGHATLSLEMVDAFSNLQAVKLLDRKHTPGSVGREYFMANRTNNTREFRALMAAWAERVRAQLDLLDTPRQDEGLSAH